MITTKTVSLPSAPSLWSYHLPHVCKIPLHITLTHEEVNICPLSKRSSLISLPRTHPLQSFRTENATGWSGAACLGPGARVLLHASSSGVKEREGRTRTCQVHVDRFGYLVAEQGDAEHLEPGQRSVCRENEKSSTYSFAHLFVIDG